MKRPSGIGIFIFSLIPFLLYADDCALGTEGGNVFMEHDHDITMVKESVYVALSRDTFKVSCKFWFYNSEKTVSRLIGFPDSRSSPIQGTKSLLNFVTRIQGKTVTVSKKIQKTYDAMEGESFADNKIWYVWETTFPAGDTVIIENYYTGNFSFCNYSRKQWFTYILGTGRTWKGNIGKGVFVFDLADLISSHWAELIVPGSLSVTKTADNRFIASFQEYEPAEEDSLELKFFAPWGRPISRNDDEFHTFLNSKTRNELRLMRNEIFARHGYVFKDKDLNDYFKLKPWYSPDRSFSISSLNEEENMTVEFIKTIENSK